MSKINLLIKYSIARELRQELLKNINGDFHQVEKDISNEVYKNMQKPFGNEKNTNKTRCKKTLIEEFSILR